MSKVLNDDLNRIAFSDIITQNLTELRDKTFVITGGTGLVGSMIIKALLSINEERKANVSIIALIRDPDKAKKIFGEKSKDIRFVVADITEPLFIEDFNDFDKIDYIIHAAAITSSKTMVEKPVETISTALCGTKNLLELARKKKAETFLYISSMEVYGDMGGDVWATEDKLGYVDPLSVRSDYPESKRMCENMCIAYSSECGVNVKIARLAQTFGPGILPWEKRVFAQFAQSVIDGRDIVLHTKGMSEGNYCYLADMVIGLFTILLVGTDRNAYNVVNEQTHCTIVEMARLVADDVAEGKISVIFDIPDTNKYGYAADTKLRLSSKKLENLGWKPTHGLKDMYIRTIEFMQEERSGEQL